jgi:GT2 family glycosyltransferase
MTAVKTTVVVMTRNRRSSLARTLSRLQSLPERPRILVVDNASDDGTPAVVRRLFPGVGLIVLRRNIGPAARTVGVEAAQTPYIAFADDDSWWRPGALARAEKTFDGHPPVAVVAGRTLVGRDHSEDPINEAMRASPLGRAPGLPGPSVLGFLACGSLVRRSAFLAVGGFRESVMGFEETPLAVELVRRGWAVVYIDDVVAEHHPAPERDGAARRRGCVRNVVVFAWLRRPVAVAIARTVRAVRDGTRDGAAFRGLIDAVRETPRLLREREVIDEALEASLRRLDL